MASAGQNKNIFELLSDESDGEMQQVKNKNTGEKRVRTRGKKTEQATTGLSNTNVNDNVNSLPKDSSRGNKDTRDARKPKGVSSKPHPNDRKDGTGRGNKGPSKGGAGKASWGTYKDEGKETLEGEEQEVEEQEPEEVVLTYEELKAEKLKNQVQKVALAQNQMDQKLLKNLENEGCSLVQKKSQIDDHFHKKAKNTKGKDNAPQINTESAELLGVRSGLQTYTEKPREDRPERQERQPRQPRQEKTEEEPAKEENEENNEEQTRRPRGERGNGRGGRGGRGRGGADRGRGGRGGGRGGNRDGNRGGNRGGNTKVANIEDDNSFPTLG